jgi:deazaflavin-dependent oxidoreductase (nitroreductase family)
MNGYHRFSRNDRLRAMYPAGRANTAARRWAHLWAAVFGLGLAPRRWVALEVIGRRSGQIRRFPVGLADYNGEWYAVSMLGERCNWVRNVRAADGRVTIRRGRRRHYHLVEVPVRERAPIIKRYLAKVPGGRPHIPLDPSAPVSAFDAIADRFPVFRVELPITSERGRGTVVAAGPASPMGSNPTPQR